MATGNFQLSMGDCQDISQPSVSRCVRTISSRIADLDPTYIKFPEAGQEEATMREFSSIAGMPGVIGCVDGTHVPIKSPGGLDVELYRCRKGFYSLNVQGICNASIRFLNIVASWPGSAHDARIFNECLVCERLQAGQYRGFLLGDSGYPCRSYLLTPFLAPSSDKERRYNSSHIRTRNTIERAFGVLKRRFAVLSIPMRLKLETSKKVIMACAVLHNIALANNMQIDDMPEVAQADPPLVPEQDHRDNVQGGHARRTQVVEDFF